MGSSSSSAPSRRGGRERGRRGAWVGPSGRPARGGGGVGGWGCVASWARAGGGGRHRARRGPRFAHHGRPARGDGAGGVPEEPGRCDGRCGFSTLGGGPYTGVHARLQGTLSAVRDR